MWIGIWILGNSFCTRPTANSPDNKIPKLTFEPIPIQFYIADSSEISEVIYAKGICKPSYEEIYSYSGNGIIEKILVQPGDRVMKNQPLVQIFDFDLNENLKSYYVEKENYRLMLEKNLLKMGYLADSVPENILRNIKISLNEPGLNLQWERLIQLQEKTTIKAGFEGLVSAVHGINGKNIYPGNPLVELIKIHPILIDFSVPSKKSIDLEKDHPLILEDSIQGAILNKHYKIDENDRQTFTGISNTNSKLLVPGKIITIGIELKKHLGIAIPKSCIIYRSGRDIVFKIDKGKPLVVPVVAKLITKNEALIEYGVVKGDTIILDPPAYLSSNTPIILVQ